MNLVADLLRGWAAEFSPEESLCPFPGGVTFASVLYLQNQTVCCMLNPNSPVVRKTEGERSYVETT